MDRMYREEEAHESRDLRYYTAEIVKSLDTHLPEGKRLPQGWTAVEVGSRNAVSVLQLKWMDVDGIADSLSMDVDKRRRDYRLRISVALDYREAQHVEARLNESDELIGRFDIRFAYVFQPFEIVISPEQAVAALREGVSLAVDGGEQPLWVFDDQGGAPERQLFAPHLLVGERSAGKAEQLAGAMHTLTSLSSLQPFGWMEGCVLDGLYALRQVYGEEQVDPAIDAHLAQYLDAEGRLLYEDLHGRQADNTFTTIEATLPLAVIAKYRPEHPIVKQAIAFWDARGGVGGGAVIDDHTVSAEGAYTVAYPLAVIAARHGRADLAQQAVRQVLLRRDCLARDRHVFLRYHQDSDTHTFRNWARAFAWYMLGTTRTYIELRQSVFAGLPGVIEIEHELIRVAEVALSWRLTDGLWCNFLDAPETGIDTSGSAGIAAALALGAQYSVLPERYLAAAEESLYQLSSYLTPDGILFGVAQHNAGGPELQRGGYRVLSQMGLGLLGQLYAAVSM